MRVAPVADIKSHFSRYLDDCQSGPVVVTKNGRAVAVLLCVADDDELERLLLAHSPRLRQILEASERDIRETGGIGHKDFWAQIEKEG